VQGRGHRPELAVAYRVCSPAGKLAASPRLRHSSAYSIAPILIFVFHDGRQLCASDHIRRVLRPAADVALSFLALSIALAFAALTFSSQPDSSSISPRLSVRERLSSKNLVKLPAL